MKSLQQTASPEKSEARLQSQDTAPCPSLVTRLAREGRSPSAHCSCSQEDQHDGPSATDQKMVQEAFLPGSRCRGATSRPSEAGCGGLTPTSSAQGTHRGRVQAAGPLLSLHGPPAVRAHPQGQVQHAVALGSHGEGQFARRLNPTLQKRRVFPLASAQKTAVSGGVGRGSVVHAEGKRSLEQREDTFKAGATTSQPLTTLHTVLRS